ncbi:hypothetical protein Hanom_Chr00s152945g01822611 [Helianthus anomalus]
MFRISFMTISTSTLNQYKICVFVQILTFKSSLRHFNKHLAGQIFLQSLPSS